MERILLVSATEKSRTMLSQFLTSCGVQAQLAPASSGAEARRMLVDGSFDLILVNTPPHTVGARSQNDETEGETRWTSITALFGLCPHGWRGL